MVHHHLAAIFKNGRHLGGDVTVLVFTFNVPFLYVLSADIAASGHDNKIAMGWDSQQYR